MRFLQYDEDFIALKVVVNAILTRQDTILKKLDAITKQETKIMATLDDVIAEVATEGTRLDSINTLISGIQAQLADALSGTTLPAAVQAKIDAVFTGLQANDAKIDTALNDNVPPVTPAT